MKECPFCGNTNPAMLEAILDEGVHYCHACGRYILPTHPGGKRKDSYQDKLRRKALKK
jgi:hypothetical protein